MIGHRPLETRREVVIRVASCAEKGLDRWYAAGADVPVLVLPPNRPPAELERMPEALAPGSAAPDARERHGLFGAFSRTKHHIT